MALQLPGIVVDIKGDSAQLKKDITQARQFVTEQATGMSNSINNALSGQQIKGSVNALVGNLSQLSQASQVTGNAFKGLGVNLGDLQKVTGTTVGQFQKLQEQILKTQTATQQEKALRSIATAAGLTNKEIESLGKQFNLSNEQIKRVVASQNELGKSTAFSLTKFKDMIITAGIYTVAFTTLSAVMRGIQGEFVAGLKAVEDFGMTIAKNTALITNFSEKAKQGDIAGAYIEANKYAKELALSMEMIDQKTIANSQHLQAMSETFIQNGVLLDINNKKQVEGFTTIANALSILTQGQNQDLQMRQEIRGLMDGEIRAADKLGSLLKAQVPDLEKQLVKWREQGTTIEEIGKLLQGFNAATGLLEDQWATVGSTMETIHNRIPRGMFEPVFKDLIKLAKEFNQSMMDAEGNLTPIARGLIAAVNEAYELMKSAGQTAASDLFDPISLSIRGTGAAVDFLKDKLEDLGSTPLEQAKRDLEEIEQQIKDLSSDSGGWFDSLGKTLFPDEAKSQLYELTTQARELQTVIRDIQNEDTRERQRFSGGGVIAPAIAAPPARSNSQARDMNAAMQARVELVKAEEEKRLEIIKRAIEQEQFLNQQSYDLGLSSYGEYLKSKGQLTAQALEAKVTAREKELAAAREAASKLTPITDKDGNFEPDKDTKAHADALRKVEDAERAVIAARADLTKAVQEGSLEEQKAAQETVRGYKEIEIQLLEMQGKDVEAARMRAELDAISIERKRLELDALAGIAGAKEALAAEEKKSALEIERLELSRLTRQKDAKLSIAELTGENAKALDIQIELLDIEIQRAELAGELPEQVEYLREQRRELEMMKDPIKAMALGFRDVTKEQELVGELMRKLARDTVKDLRATFQDTLVMGMKGDFDSIGEAWESLMDTMLDRFLNMIANLTMNSLFEVLGMGEIMGGGATWGQLFSGSSGGQSGGGGGAGGAVGSLVTSAVLGYVKDYVMTNLITPAWNSLTGAAPSTTAGGTSAVSGTAATGSYFAGSGGAVSGATSFGASEAAAAGAGSTGGGVSLASLGMGAMYALPAAAFAFQTMNTKRREAYWNEAGVTTDDFAALDMDVSGAFYNILDASEQVKDGLNTLGVNFGEFAGLSIDAANGIAITGTAIRDAETNLVEGIDYQISYFDMAAGRWKETGNLFENLLNQMSEMNPVTDDAIDAVAAYVSEMAGVPSAADELSLAFVQMQTGVYDLAGAVSAAAMETAAAAEMAGASAMMAHQYAAGSQAQFNYNQSIRQRDFADVPMSGYDLGIEGHADGGIHRGGWRMVGERGPELEYTPPSRIFSNTDTNSILNGLKGGDKAQQITIPISIGNEALTTLVVSIADKHISVRERQGVTGRAYAR